jgi:serine/alanine adding enzyme
MPQDALTLSLLSTPDELLAWDSFVAQFPEGHHHHSDFIAAISQATRHKTFLIGAFEGSQLVAALPLVLVSSKLFGRHLCSLPFLNYGGVLSNDERGKEAVLAYALELMHHHNAKCLQIRESQAYSDVLLSHLDAEPPACEQHKVNMVLTLPEDMKQIGEGNAKKRAKLRSQAQLAVRKTQDSGDTLTQVFGHAELLNDFHAVFAQHMRDLGTPVYGKAFFTGFLEQLGHHAMITVSYLNGEPVGAGFLFIHGDRISIPWASTLRKVNHLSLNANMYWNILEKAKSRGALVFDFGRSTVDAGTYKFKKQWGAEPQACYWYSWTPEGVAKPDLSPSSGGFSLAVKVWQRLPLFLTNTLGPSIVKNIP